LRSGFRSGINDGSFFNERFIVFFKRNNSSEIMDDFSIIDERIDLALHELKMINKYLGGDSTSKTGMRKMLGKSFFRNIKILDAGAGASVPLLSMQNNYSNLEIFCVDKNIRVCKYLKRSSPNLKVVCADIFKLPFKEKYFDIIHASLFLHHFDGKRLNILLQLFKNISKFGIIVNDLRRNVFAYYGIKILTQLFSQSEMVKNDAPVSVKRGFIKSELVEVLNSMNILNFEIIRKWAFRWLIVIYF
jgi:2-polyprenyl-3-methyl-5-hydroxy-6-metoxy-1,4-benzoquinol methylase